MENIQLTTGCLKSINHIGGTTYQNVCNGMMNYVSWGAGDWIGILFATALMVGMFAVIPWMIWRLIRD